MSRRVMLGAGGALVVVFVAWFLVLWGPQGGRVADADARKEAAAGVNSQLEARVARLQSAQAGLPGLQADLETLRVAVPDSPDLAQFILDANDAATNAGVDFLSISPSPPAANADPAIPPSVALVVNVKGGYFQVRDYLNRLNDLSRLVVVDNLTLTPNETESGGQELAATLTGRMFTTTVPVEAGAVVVPPPAAAATPTDVSTAPEAAE